MVVDLTIEDIDIKKAARIVRTSIADGLASFITGAVSKAFTTFKEAVKKFIITPTLEIIKAISNALKILGLVSIKVQKDTKVTDITVKELQRRCDQVDRKSMNRLIQDIQSKKKSEAQVLSILNMYKKGLSTWAHYALLRLDAHKNSLQVWAFRRLSPEAEHCPDCPIYANYGIVKA